MSLGILVEVRSVNAKNTSSLHDIHTHTAYSYRRAEEGPISRISARNTRRVVDGIRETEETWLGGRRKKT